LLRRYRPTKSVALRFGRFFYPSQSEYQLRKLSTGLDVRDACQAVALALITPTIPRAVYCVASDLPLSSGQREDLGIDVERLLRELLPGLADELRRRGQVVPARVGKSVDTTLARRDLGFRPERNLAWYHKQLFLDKNHMGGNSQRRLPAFALESSPVAVNARVPIHAGK
jgi:hypothetical protein